MSEPRATTNPDIVQRIRHHYSRSSRSSYRFIFPINTSRRAVSSVSTRPQTRSRKSTRSFRHHPRSNHSLLLHLIVISVRRTYPAQKLRRENRPGRPRASRCHRRYHFQATIDWISRNRYPIVNFPERERASTRRDAYVVNIRHRSPLIRRRKWHTQARSA